MSDAERLDEAIERLLADQSPRFIARDLDDEERQMLQFAQLLRGTQVDTPDDAAIERIRERALGQPRVSRRVAFVSGIGALAAGLLGGIGIDRAAHNSSGQASAWNGQALVGDKGKWVRVASVAQVPEGTVHTFDAGAVQGFLMRRGTEVRALSRICTHMGCRLDFSQSEQAFICPCHGAEFNLQGKLEYGPGRYPLALPPLPRIDARVKGDAIEVWTA